MTRPAVPILGSREMLDTVARAICCERRSFLGLPPCYARADAQGNRAWPNPDCNDPGCQVLAAVAIVAARIADDAKR